jgi:hypothetical protein
MNNINLKYTAVLPNEYVSELKALAAKKIIPSVNYGIKKAVAKYLEESKKEIYEKSMAEAAKDKNFLKRTSDCQNDFINVDSEAGEEW